MAGRSRKARLEGVYQRICLRHPGFFEAAPLHMRSTPDSRGERVSGKTTPIEAKLSEAAHYLLGIRSE